MRHFATTESIYAGMNILKYQNKNAKTDLPKRTKTANKTHGGKCLVVAGATGMWGAAILCAKAAARIGAGYVYLLTNNKSKFPVLKNPDFLTVKSPQRENFKSVVIGPGFKNHKKLKAIILQLIKTKYPNVVVDAEALKVVAKLKIKIPSTWILTPHEGELGKMLNVSSGIIRANRKKYTAFAQKKWNCIVILKGHKTLVASKNKIYEIQSGNAALAKAGTGDVLAGIIAGLLSQKVTPEAAACLGAYVHGFTADMWIKKNKDELSLMASDIIDDLPVAIKKIR